MFCATNGSHYFALPQSSAIPCSALQRAPRKKKRALTWQPVQLRSMFDVACAIRRTDRRRARLPCQSDPERPPSKPEHPPLCARHIQGVIAAKLNQLDDQHALQQPSPSSRECYSESAFGVRPRGVVVTHASSEPACVRCRPCAFRTPHSIGFSALLIAATSRQQRVVRVVRLPFDAHNTHTNTRERRASP